ncbi:MAG: hypothetical protein AMS19_01460 [Gemmatimonas sp. SG8_23]|jgi:hypothetical protein|nr:MAG: hypothetical protein AMS19_01460 [Gemmatimonas sp. SG8_23]
MNVFSPTHRAGIIATMAAIVLPVSASAQVAWQDYRVRAVRTETQPVLDGFLEQEVWGRGGLIDELIQQEPLEGAPATERTEIYLLYDARTLYFGIRAFDSGTVTATEMRRDSDQILSEDNVQIILDTFKDSRSGYMFVTNPLGAQFDQQVFNEGEGAVRGFGLPTSNINKDWDGVWDVAARIVDDGWIAEIAIPMVTLRFPAGQTQDWGMNVMRNIGRKNEQAFWAPIAKEFNIYRVSMAGSLEGMSDLDRGMDLRVTPFVTGGASSVLEQQVETDDLEGDLGVDMKYGITAGLNLDITVNTDFAQAEVDDEQVNLTRFPLFFPEKRDFFLENSGQFNVGSVNAFARSADLFFSRRIGLTEAGDAVPIIAGARLTGKVGRNDIAVMNVQTNEFSGLGDSPSTSAENFLVAKYSRNIWSRSRVGALFINKASTNFVGDIDSDHVNRTYAVDAVIAPHPNFNITTWLAKTETPDFVIPPDDPETPDRDDLGYGELGGYVNATWLDTDWRIYGEYVDLDKDFNPEVGFLPRAGIRTTKLHLERNPRPDFLGIRVLSPMVNYTYTSSQTGLRLASRWHYMVGVTFDNGAFFNVWFNDHFDRVERPFTLNGVEIPAGDYQFGEWRVSFDSNPSRRVYYGLMYAPQGFYGGDRWDAQVKLGARITDRLSTEASYTRNDVTLPNGDFDVDLASLRIDLGISPTMSIRSLTQYNSQSDQFGTSARFRWTYKPGSDLFVVYNELRRDPQTDFLYRDRSLILKATFLLTR